MVKDKRSKEKQKGKGEIEGGRKVVIGLIRNCAAEVKLILTALLVLCCFATLLQFLPARLFPLYSHTETLPACLTVPPPVLLEEVLDNGVVRRSLDPVGTAAYNFILMSAYRGGSNTFAIMGLSSKPLHVFGHPTYTCEYHSNKKDSAVISVCGRKILPDWGYGRVYTAVVINCTFPDMTENITFGGRLVLLASADTVVALNEAPNSWNISKFTNSIPKYDYLYCGSPLYGNLSPQRVREWIAYHVRLFGERSHFVIYDAGGIHPQVFQVLKPWIELGFVTVQDIREQERFDGYYHNQFLVVNDCLHRYRFDSKWMFFFDVDEFIHLSGGNSFRSVMDSLNEFSQFTIKQMSMSNQLCLLEDAANITNKWGFEKLVYKNVKKVRKRDRKYAIQPRNVFATGVHLSQNFQGRSSSKTSDLIKYYHYHGTIAQRHEPCRRFINDTSATTDGVPFLRDTNMKYVAHLVKKFELETIGSTLQSTTQ